MKLLRLPNRLASIATTRLPTLQTKAGATPRTRGSAWMAIRQRVKLRDSHTCAGCGSIRNDHEVDHIVPLEQGGTDEMSNLQLLCAWFDDTGVKRGCHADKSAIEAKERGGFKPW